MKKSIVTGLVLLAGASFAGATTFTLNPTADCRLLQVQATTNDNSEGLSTFNAATNEQRTLIQFDYSSLAGMTITSATLTLQGKSFGGSTAQTSIDFYRATSAWVENLVTWNSRTTGSPWTNPGADAVGTTGSQLTDPYTHWVGNQTAAIALYNFDVTSLVSGAVNGDFTNNGMLMTGALGNQLVFESREGHVLSGTGTAVPVLTVEATAAPEPAPIVGLVIGLAAIGARKRQTKKS
jgi:hypothetical protein